jgi:hypothetical protein
MKKYQKLILWGVMFLSAVLIIAGCGSNVAFKVATPAGGLTVYNPVVTLLNSAGLPTGRLASGDSISFLARGCRPCTQYDIRVFKSAKQAGEDTLISYLRLTSNANGDIPSTIMAYDLEAGNYYYTMDEVGASRNKVASKINKAATSFTVNTEATYVRIYACDNLGTRKSAFTPGEEVYVAGFGFTPGATVNLYVLRDQNSWTDGDPLSDVSGVAGNAGTPEEAVVAGDGTIPPTLVWSSAGTTAGNAYDIVADVNTNGAFNSATDIVKDYDTVGFVVQNTPVAARAAFTAQLACDANRIYKDTFQTNEDVYVFINPSTRMQLGGDRYVKKFVVAHKDSWTTGDPLIDVSGPNNPWDADTVQSGCTNEGRVLVWPGTLTPGSYDVVIDVNRNGVYDEGTDIIDGIGNRNGSIAAGFRVIPPPNAKKWTVMVYINADNNLDSCGVDDLQEMVSSGGSNADVNVVAQMDRASFGTWTTVRRYYVTSGMDVATGHLEDLGELNCGDPDTLINFVQWAASNYPASHYMLVIWNHGAGVRKDITSSIFKGISYDDTSGGDGINMEELRYAMSRIYTILGKKVEVLGMDACLMAMTEVAYQIRNFADYLVGSQDTEPGDGWPYDVILPRVLSNPDIAASALSTFIVNDYIASYPGNNSVTQSAVDLSKMDALKSAVDLFAQKMMEKMETFRTVLQDQRNSTQSYDSGYPDYRDLYHFADLVEANVTGDEGADIRTAAAGVKTALTNAVLAENHGRRGPVDNSNGLCIWLPDRQYNSNYSGIYFGTSFAIDTQWNEFIADLWGSLLRIELTWGAEPRDMDSHLWDTYGNHVCYYNMAINGAYLDLDDVSGYGPENVTVTSYNIGGGSPYTYAVHRYSGSTPPSAPIVVKLFRGANPAPVQTWSTSGFTSSLIWWHVFDLDPATGAITTINTLSSGSPRVVEEGKMPKK